MIVLECGYEPDHSHEFPEDWEFGGADGTDPRADPRWSPTTYVYLDDHFDPIWTTQTPLCLDQAIDEFTHHRTVGAAYLQRHLPGGELELVDFRYDGDSDTVYPLGE